MTPETASRILFWGAGDPGHSSCTGAAKFLRARSRRVAAPPTNR
jgi:hypothetical protein